jgi:hypothetical protein
MKRLLNIPAGGGLIVAINELPLSPTLRTIALALAGIALLYTNTSRPVELHMDRYPPAGANTKGEHA